MGSVADVYRQTRKKPDLVWNTYVARPVAAVVVTALRGTRVTPNQITIAAVFVALASAALLVFMPGYIGLVAAVVVFELSYVLDCADGMLARFRQTASTGGHLLDFLMDELKAFVLLGAAAVRLFRFGAPWFGPKPGSPALLMLGIAGLVCLASGIALTTFQRRPEIAGKPADSPNVVAPRRSLVGRAVGLVERVAKLLIHYPSYILFVGLSGHLELYFYPYIAVNALYAVKAFTSVTLRFGRS